MSAELQGKPPAGCVHKYLERTGAPLPGVCASRICTRCDRLEVQLAKTGQWLTIEEYQEASAAGDGA